MFNKIKNILRKIFIKQKLLQKSENVEQIDNKIKFKTNEFKAKLSKDSEIYNIKRMYEEDKITEDDLTISQIKQLIGIYKEQLGQ